jgi:outer membrane lipoprotein carrier protein
MMRIGGAVLAAVLAVVLTPATGEALSASAVAKGLREKYAALEDLSAVFKQESKVVSLGRSRRKEGTIRFKKPGRMRWDYTVPDSQLIIADGEKLWYFRPDRNQVVVQELSRAFANQTPLFFLFGEGDLSTEFTWGEGDLVPDGKGNFVLALKPRVETPDLVDLTLEVRKADFTVFATVLRDAFGNVTRLEFSEEKENGGLADELFTFDPPPGAEVIRP